MNIKPGLPVKIVLDVDHIREKSDVRNSIIFDINENMLIMAQTEPLILKSSINKTVLLTYLARENRNVVRYGFDADIFDLIMDYELSVDNKTKAIILIKKTDPVQHNLRFFFRIEPPIKSGIEIFIHGKPVSILDISIGGAKISYRRDLLKLQSNKIVELRIHINTAFFDIKALVVRIWSHKEEKMARILEFASFEFINTSSHFKNILGKKIFDIQRELRSKDIL